MWWETIRLNDYPLKEFRKEILTLFNDQHLIKNDEILNNILNASDNLSNEMLYTELVGGLFSNTQYGAFSSEDPDKLVYLVINAIDDRKIAKVDLRKVSEFIQSIRNYYKDIKKNYVGRLSSADSDAFGVSSDNESFILLEAFKEVVPGLTFCIIDCGTPNRSGWFSKHYIFYSLPMNVSKIGIWTSKMNKWLNMQNSWFIRSINKFEDISKIKYFDITYKTLKNDIKLIKSGKVKWRIVRYLLD